MKTDGNKTQLLISDRSMSATILKLCHHHSNEVEVRGNDAASVELACATAWDLLIVYSETQDSVVVENCRRIKAANPLGQILVVVGVADPVFSASCLQVGADEVVVSPWNDIEFSARISVAMRRSNQLLQLQRNGFGSSPAQAIQSAEQKPKSTYQHVGDVQLCPIKREVAVHGELVHLTRTEYLLLTYLIRRTNLPCSSVELLNNVLGYEDENYVPSLHSHISRLRRKIRRSITTSIDTIWCYGYRITLD